MMLTIRKEQLEMFERFMFKNMQTRVEQTIAAIFPDICAEPEDREAPLLTMRANAYCKAITAEGIAAADAFGMERESDIKAFVALGLALQRSARPAPSWLTQWLDRPHAGPLKLAIIESRLQQLGENDPLLLAIADSVRRART
ncbi:hypothetical protein RugamoR57_03690 [Duganella caerulea]|uniref:hypothetical protein n=1 Tax=Duganella caerulea TaxID=2885762 RepID=UPI0030E907FA